MEATNEILVTAHQVAQQLLASSPGLSPSFDNHHNLFFRQPLP